MSTQRRQVRRSFAAKADEDALLSMKGDVPETQPGGPPRTVATPAAAEIVGRSPDTLKRWRHEGVGPEYIVFRGRVRYDVRVLNRFNEENTRMPSVRAAMEAEREGF